MRDLSELAAAVRRLELPLAPELGTEAVVAVAEGLEAQGLSFEDCAERFRQLVEAWWESGTGADLRPLVFAALSVGFPEGGRLQRTYLHVHDELEAIDLLTPDQARSLLSHARLIQSLSTLKMSASQVARVLTALGAHSDVHWRAVQRVMRAMGVQPRLPVKGAMPPTIASTLTADRTQGIERFVDAGLKEAAEAVAEMGRLLGYDGDLVQLLGDLADINTGHRIFFPYLQLLHLQCMIAAFYDHPVTMAYEFGPRGVSAAWLHDVYKRVSTGSAVLNNAKAVDRLDHSWARMRRGDTVAASALVDVLMGLERMPFEARADLASWIRQWLLRVLTLSREPRLKVPDRATGTVVRRALAAIGVGNTRTYGILEQRTVDALASVLQPASAGWVPRGLGAAVNATNLSTHRLGDCDFQRLTPTPQVMAFEVTAGRLTETYLQGHLRTLRRSLALRADELGMMAPLSRWTVEVRFIAHSFSLSSRWRIPGPNLYRRSGPAVKVSFWTFKELESDARHRPTSSLTSAFTTHVHHVLNAPRTPQLARKAYIALTR